MDFCQDLHHSTSEALSGFCQKGNAPSISFFDEDLDLDANELGAVDTEEGL